MLVLRNPSSVIAALVIRVARVCTGQHCRPLCISSPVSHSPWLTRLHMEPELCNLMSFLHMTCFLPRCSLGPRLLQNYWDKSLSCPAHLSLSSLLMPPVLGLWLIPYKHLHFASASFYYLPKANLDMPGFYSLGRTPPGTLLVLSLLLHTPDIDMVISTTLSVPHTPFSF